MLRSYRSVSIRGAESSPDHSRAVNGRKSSYRNQDEEKYLPPIYLITSWIFWDPCAEQVTKSILKEG